MQSASDRHFYQTAHMPADLVSAFKAPQDSIRSRTTQYLPPSTAIPPLNKTTPSNVMRFMIPQGGAIDTKTVRLHMNLQVAVDAVTGSSGHIRLDNAGWGALVQSINVYESGQIIEQINNASVLQAMLNQSTPEDYQEGVLKITEGCQYIEDKESDSPAGFLAPKRALGGKTLVQFNSNAGVNGADKDKISVPSGGDMAAVSANYSCSLNLPIGIFNTNKPLFTHLYGGISIEIIFNPWTYALVWSPSTQAAGGVSGSAITGAKVHASFDKTTVVITDTQLRYDLLSLSEEFQSMMLGSIRSMGSFEYIYNSFRMYQSQLTNGTRQIIKISGTSGSILESITFGFIQAPAEDPCAPSQSMFTTMRLKSFYFQIGGLRVPNREISVSEAKKSDGNDAPYAYSAEAGSYSVTANETDGFVEACKALNIFKSYQVGVKGGSSLILNSDAATATADLGYTYVGKTRRLYSYSFQQSYDAEVVSGFVLGDSSEISIVLEFDAQPAVNTRMYTALNYSQKLVTDASGRVFNEL